MSIPSNIPQIAALRTAVETKYGSPVRTHCGFMALVQEIESVLHEHISESSLERIWEYSTRRTDAIAERTLDVLAKFAGHESWFDFCEIIRQNSESDELKEPVLLTEDIPVGSNIRIGWQPDRIVSARYEGSYQFTIVESENSSLKKGDAFKCLQFQKGKPLYLDCFCRLGKTDSHRYVVGKINGISLLEIN